MDHDRPAEVEVLLHRVLGHPNLIHSADQVERGAPASSITPRPELRLRPARAASLLPEETGSREVSQKGDHPCDGVSALGALRVTVGTAPRGS